MLPLIHSGNVKRLRVAPPEPFSDDNVWVIIHDSKTSRHSRQKAVFPSLRLSLRHQGKPLSPREHRQMYLGQAGGVMATGFEIRTLRGRDICNSVSRFITVAGFVSIIPWVVAIDAPDGAAFLLNVVSQQRFFRNQSWFSCLDRNRARCSLSASQREMSR